MLKNPKWTDFVFWGVFKGVFVSRIMELKGLGYIFASDCIPKLLFQRFGVFLRGRMYPKWSVLHDLGCMGLRISQTSCFLNYELFFRASNISNGSTFTANLIFERAKRQSAKNMLNRQNQPKKYTICTQVYAKSLNLRLLAYVLPLQAALTGANNLRKPIKRMLNRQI